MEKLQQQEKSLLEQREKLQGKSIESMTADELEERQVKLDGKFRRMDSLNQVMMSFGQLTGGLSSGATQLIQADAEKFKGEAEKAAQHSEESTDWMHSIQEMITVVHQKLQAIQESQNQTMQAIYRV